MDLKKVAIPENLYPWQAHHESLCLPHKGACLVYFCCALFSLCLSPRLPGNKYNFSKSIHGFGWEQRFSSIAPKKEWKLTRVGSLGALLYGTVP